MKCVKSQMSVYDYMAKASSAMFTSESPFILCFDSKSL